MTANPTASGSDTRSHVDLVGPAIVRMGLERLLQRDSTLAIGCSGAAISDVEGCVHARSVSTGLVVVVDDGRLDSPQQFAAMRRLVADRPVLVLLAASAGRSAATGRQAAALLEAGVAGCVLVDSDPAVIIAAAGAALRGERPLDPRLTTEIVAAIRAQANAVAELTDRQRDVFELAAAGLSDRGIASRLGLTELMVRGDLAAAFRHVGVHSRREAAAWIRAQTGAMRRPPLDAERPTLRVVPG